MARRRSAHGWYHPVSIVRALACRPKVLFAIGVGIVAALVLPGSLTGAVRTTIAWDLAALSYLVAVFGIMIGEPPDDIRKRAAAHDESALIIPIIVVAAIAASFLAVAGVLSAAKDASAETKPLFLLLAGSTIVLSWFVMQTVFTIHYAHEFYAPPLGDQKPEAALDFPGDEKPDYWDFLYFSATIGATSQTSDTGVCTPQMRRLVTTHAIISFFFNTIVLALTINIAASLI